MELDLHDEYFAVHKMDSTVIHHCSEESMLQTLDSKGCLRSRRTDSTAEVSCGRRYIEIVISKGLITASSNYIT